MKNLLIKILSGATGKAGMGIATTATGFALDNDIIKVVGAIQTIIGFIHKIIKVWQEKKATKKPV